MDIQHGLVLAGQYVAFAGCVLTAMLSAIGTARNLLSHAGFVSVEERTKLGAVLDRFALVCEKGKKGITWVLSLPGFASRDAAAPAPDLKIVPLLLVGLFALNGCATTNTPANATTGQKLIADSAALVSIVNDCKAKCAAEFAPLGPVVVAALQIAASPEDVLSDIMAVVQASPALYKDGQGVACIIKTVIDDLKALKPQPGTKQADMLEMAQQALALLDTPSPSAFACAQ